MNRLYYKYSEYLIQKYGQKVYKIPLNIPSSCPNRDGTKSYDGCIFCAPDGSGHENMREDIDLCIQYNTIRKILEEKYKATKYIAFFQSYSNTYMPLDKFKYYMKTAAHMDSCVALSISTRPDCLEDSYMEFLKELKKEHNIDICIEIGLQSTNNNTLKILNRHHSVYDVVVAAEKIKSAGFELCTHIIADLPWDGKKDILNTAKLINEIKTDSLKIHSLYVAKDTMLEKMYYAGKIHLLSLDEYVERIILLLENIHKDIAIQRLVSRVTERLSVICTWNKSWRKIVDIIENKLLEMNSYQGKALENK
jgi:hypothetical protein